MSSMKLCIVAVTLVLTLASAAPGLESKKCRPPGEKCAGGRAEKEVPWVNCCKGGCDSVHPSGQGLMCTPESGRVFPPKKKEDNAKCRKPGERCIGAEGKPPVEWINCCGGYCNTPHPDWGFVCDPAGDTPHQKAKKLRELHKTNPPKCRAPGEMCSGAFFRPVVQWIPCCEGACDTRHKNWGRSCTPKDSNLPKDTRKPLYTAQDFWDENERVRKAESKAKLAAA